MFEGHVKEILLGGQSHGLDGRKDTAASTEDFQVRGSLQAEGKFLLSSFGKTHMGVRINKARDETHSLAVHFDVCALGCEGVQDFLLGTDLSYQPILAIDRASLKALDFALPLSSERSATIYGGEDPSVSKKFGDHFFSSPSMSSSRCSIT